MALTKTDIRELEQILGATHKGSVPDTGGGAFGAARLAAILSARLRPANGKRRGRPSDPEWVRREKVPMKEETVKTLEQFAELFSSEGETVSPMQFAAQVLENGLEELKAQLKKKKEKV